VVVHATERASSSLSLEHAKEALDMAKRTLEAPAPVNVVETLQKLTQSISALKMEMHARNSSVPPAVPDLTKSIDSQSGVTNLNYSNQMGHTFIVHNVNFINGFGPSVEKNKKARDAFDTKSDLDETRNQIKELMSSQTQLKKQIRQEEKDLAKSEKETSNPSGVNPGSSPLKQVLTDAPIHLRRPWYNWGGDYADAQVSVENGVCYLHGLVRGNGGRIGTLPEICRPKQGRLVFSVMKGGQPARVDILNDGRIYHVAGGETGWLSLDGISFALNIGPSIRLVNDWQPFGGSYRTPSLWVKDGLCMASGIIRGGKWGNFVLLPEECTPMQRLVFSSNNHEKITRMDVLTAEMGAFIARAGGFARHGWVSLDGMAWTQNGGQAIEPSAPWKNYGGAYQPLRWERIGRLCVVSGLVTSTDWKDHIVRLPDGCRPEKRTVFGVNVHMSSARVDVLPDGRVFYLNGKLDWDWLSLSGIKFIVKDGTKPTALNNPKVDAPPMTPVIVKRNAAVDFATLKNGGSLVKVQDNTMKN